MKMKGKEDVDMTIGEAFDAMIEMMKKDYENKAIMVCKVRGGFVVADVDCNDVSVARHPVELHDDINRRLFGTCLEGKVPGNNGPDKSIPREETLDAPSGSGPVESGDQPSGSGCKG